MLNIRYYVPGIVLYVGGRTVTECGCLFSCLGVIRRVNRGQNTPVCNHQQVIFKGCTQTENNKSRSYFENVFIGESTRLQCVYHHSNHC